MALLIDVIGTDDSTTPHARAYAEYRVFAALARYTRLIRRVRVELRHADGNGSAGCVTCRVRVELRHADGNGSAGCVTCAVHLTLQPSGSARARARGPHAFATIDRVAERIRDVMARRSPERISS